MLAVSEILRHLCFLGATRTKDARELLYARQKVVVTTKAFGLQAIDLVHIDYKDLEGLRQQAREGALMGFTGKVLYIRVSAPVPFNEGHLSPDFNIYVCHACLLLILLVSVIASHFSQFFICISSFLYSSLWHHNGLASNLS